MSTDLQISAVKKVHKGQFLHSKFKSYYHARYLFLLLLPGITAMFIFSYLPMYGILIAFEDFKIVDGMWGSQWVGLSNFLFIFQSEQTLNAIKNSFIISLYGLAVSFPCTILFALLLNEIKNALSKKMFQSLSYLPYFLSWVIVSKFVIDVLSPSSGLVNKIIELFGIHAVNFMVEPMYFKTILVFSSLWKNIGWGSVIYMAAITNVSNEVYEAAIIDGANRLKRAIHVTLPAMYPVISIVLILQLSTLFNGGDFEQIMNLVNSQTYSSGEVISTLTYKLGLGNLEYSISTAFGLFQTVLALVILFISNTIIKRFSEYTIW